MENTFTEVKGGKLVKRTPRTVPAAPEAIEKHAEPERTTPRNADRREREKQITVGRPVVYQVDNKWFKDRMAAANMSLRTIAAKIDMQPSALSLTLQGKRKMGVEEAGRIARELGESVDEVLRHAGVDVRGFRSDSVVIAGYVDQDGDVAFGPVAGPGSIPGPEGSPGSLRALRINAEGPFDGWVLFYKEKLEMGPEAVDRLCVVRTKERSALQVCWVRRGWSLDLWKLVPLIPGNAETQSQVVSASPILWMKQ